VARAWNRRMGTLARCG